MSDGTYSNETRLGAVPDILKGIEHFDLTQSDVLVIGGDTLFLHDFDIKAFLDYYHQQDGPTCLVARYTVPDKDVSKMGIMEINKDGIMIGFLEKPSFSHSRFGCPCFYLFPKEALHYLDLFVNLAHSSKESYDATGKFLAYLYPQFKIATFPISGRVDVGGLDSYKEANDLLKKETKTK
ncbi:nucleotide-diphospho-sugar transferase [Pilobolus umbonatus]|nr:nucleotide-diphospho-sugar transferase [Pilobolus umbonatus]